MFTFNQIIQLSQQHANVEWEKAVAFIKAYNGTEQQILGLKFYLETNNYSKEALRQYIKQIEKSNPVHKKNILRKVPTWVPVAAASIILALGFMLNNKLQKESVHIVEAPLSVFLDDNNLLLNKAMSLYKKGDYKQAQEKFSTLQTDTAMFYQAVCFEMMGENEKALNILQQVLPTSNFYTNSLLRMVANHITLGNTTEAHHIIMSIVPVNASEAEKLRKLKLALD